MNLIPILNRKKIKIQKIGEILISTILLLVAQAQVSPKSTLSQEEFNQNQSQNLDNIQTPPNNNNLPTRTFGVLDPPPEGYSPPPFEEGPNNRINVYRLGPGDTVTINVINFPEFNVTGLIDPEGNLIVPILGRISAQGLTLQELETKISYELGTRFLVQQPDTIAVLAVARPVQLTILGEISRPGFYTVGPGTPLIAVLFQAGGSTSNADLRSVVIRRTLADQTVIEQKVDLYTPLLNGSFLPRVNLQGGDTIVLTRLEVGTDEGYDRNLIARSTIAPLNIRVRVLAPVGNNISFRNIVLNNGSTFLDVIASLPPGDDILIDDDITLIRFDPEKGGIVSQRIDSRDAINGAISQNVLLKDEDVIVVSRTLLGRIFTAFNAITTPIRSVFGFANFFDNIFGDNNGGGGGGFF